MEQAKTINEVKTQKKKKGFRFYWDVYEEKL